MTAAIPFDDFLEDILPIGRPVAGAAGRPPGPGESACGGCGCAATFFFRWTGQGPFRPPQAWCAACAPREFTPGRMRP